MQPLSARVRRCCFGVVACQQLESRRLLSTIYVDASAPAPHDGTTWGSAYVRLTVALNNASSGDTIKMANGMYFPTTGTDQSATFQLINGVTIMGGFAGYGAANPDLRNITTFQTTLSGELGSPDNEFDNSNAVVTGSGTNATAVLDGVTITAGIHGMHNAAGSPTVRNCNFSENMDGGPGSGVYNTNASDGTFTNCSFFHNFASGTGAGAENNNSSPTFANCLFLDNNAGGYGAGISNVNGSSPMIVDCRFLQMGGTTDQGGAIADFTSSPTIINCLFVSDSAYGYGGAVGFNGGSGLIVNCTFDANGYVSSPPNATVTHQGGAVAAVGGANVTMRNCILWADTAVTGPEVYRDATSTLSITFSDIEGGHAGAGNIDADPKFLTNAVLGFGLLGDQRLKTSSPCIDAGDNSAIPSGITTDLAGAPRLSNVIGVHDPGLIVDMGAYEHPGLILQAGGPSFGIVSNPLITIHFNEPIAPAGLDVNDLELDRPGAVPLVTDRFATLSYNAATQTATWNFDHPLPDGNYNAILPAGAVNDMYGYPTEADATAPFFFLNGDANHDDHVDVTDLGILATNWQGSGKTFAQGDFNLDGVVNVTDLGILATNWQKSVAPPAAPLAVTAIVPKHSQRFLVEDLLLA